MKSKISKINVIIPAGGTSERYGQKNKLFEPLNDTCVLIEAIKPFLSFKEVGRVIVGIDSSYSDELLSALDNARLDDSRIILSAGGATRTKTVRLALSALEDDADVIITHDGARPFVNEKLIARAISAIETCDAAVPVTPMTDALLHCKDGEITSVDRQFFKRVQTPFIAKRNIFEKAYKSTENDFYDDVSVIQTLNCAKIATFNGDIENIKITYPQDLPRPSLTGCGYDIHRMAGGSGIKLCGIRIDCPYSFVAHSDGDVPVHALMDAILTALGKKDIGHYFPVDDPAYDGANSMQLLSVVLDIAQKDGYKPSNASLSIIAENPRLAPYIDAMRASLATALDVPISKVGISATTNEQVGLIGSSHAIAAFATVTLLVNATALGT